MKKSDDERLNHSVKNEAAFFDKVYADADISQSKHLYSIPEDLVRQVTNPSPFSVIDREYACSIMGDLEDKYLLDYGAGDGWNAICFAKAKARVWAIDVSGKGIELTKRKALANGVSDQVKAMVRDCYETGFADDMFDIIYGGGVLHHLDMKSAGKELARILKHDGAAIFYEPIRDNKVIDIVKYLVLRVIRRKPSEESEDEAPLTSERIKLLQLHFGSISCRKFNVLSNMSKLFKKSKKLRMFLSRIDNILMKIIPGFEKLCTAVVLELRLPRKKSVNPFLVAKKRKYKE